MHYVISSSTTSKLLFLKSSEWAFFVQLDMEVISEWFLNCMNHIWTYTKKIICPHSNISTTFVKRYLTLRLSIYSIQKTQSEQELLLKLQIWIYWVVVNFEILILELSRIAFGGENLRQIYCRDNKIKNDGYKKKSFNLLLLPDPFFVSSSQQFFRHR